MRLAFATDLHGREEFYKRLLEHAWRARLDAVILGGDLLPHGGEVVGMDDAAADVAYQASFVHVFLEPLLAQFARIAPWCRVLFVPGEHDWGASDAALGALCDRGLLHALAGRRVEAPGGFELVGCAWVPPLVHPILDRLRAEGPVPAPWPPAFASDGSGAKPVADPAAWLVGRADLASEVASLPAPSVPARTVLVSHAPPIGTRTDAQAAGHHGGSVAVRAWLERVQPMLALVGHCADSPYRSGAVCDRVGATVVVNPGQGALAPHWIELDLADPRAGVRHSVLGAERPFDLE